MIFYSYNPLAFFCYTRSGRSRAAHATPYPYYTGHYGTCSLNASFEKSHILPFGGRIPGFDMR